MRWPNRPTDRPTAGDCSSLRRPAAAPASNHRIVLPHKTSVLMSIAGSGGEKRGRARGHRGREEQPWAEEREGGTGSGRDDNHMIEVLLLYGASLLRIHFGCRVLAGNDASLLRLRGCRGGEAGGRGRCPRRQLSYGFISQLMPVVSIHAQRYAQDAQHRARAESKLRTLTADVICERKISEDSV